MAPFLLLAGLAIPAMAGPGARGPQMGGAGRTKDADGSAPTSQAPPAAGADYLLPEPPALVLLDSSGTRFDEPSAPADFAVSAGQILGEDASLQAGGAVELGLRSFGLTRGVSARDYLEKPMLRLLTRSYVSLATAAGVESDDVVLAIGARSLLVDGADPYLDRAYIQAARDAIALCEEERESGAADWADRYSRCLDKAYQEEAAALADARWNAFGLMLSAAGSLEFPGGSYGETRGGQLGGWLSLALPAGPAAQLGFGTGWTQSFTEDPHQLGLSTLARGGGERARMRTELGVAFLLPSEAPAAGEDSSVGLRLPVTLGGEFLLQRELWVALSFGVIIDPETQLVSAISQGTFRWGHSSEPSFLPSSQLP